MKTLTTAFLIIISYFSFAQVSPADFNRELTKISQEFRAQIMDKDACEALRGNTADLSSKIRNALKMIDRYSENELNQLKELKTEANALEEFISVISGSRVFSFSLKEFHLANKRIRASVTKIDSDKYCVDIIKIEIGEYVTFFAENTTDKNFQISYKWKAPNGQSGNGSMGVELKSIRHIYNNRDSKIKQNISVINIDCEEF